MNDREPDCLWLDAQVTIGLSELAGMTGIGADELQELVGYRAIAPVATATREPLFHAGNVTVLRRAAKLRADYDIDLFSLALLIDHMVRIDRLEDELRTLRARS